MRDRRPAAALMIIVCTLVAVKLFLDNQRYIKSLADQQPDLLGSMTILFVAAYLSLRLIPLMRHYAGIFAQGQAVADQQQHQQRQQGLGR